MGCGASSGQTPVAKSFATVVPSDFLETKLAADCKKSSCSKPLQPQPETTDQNKLADFYNVVDEACDDNTFNSCEGEEIQIFQVIYAKHLSRVISSMNRSPDSFQNYIRKHRANIDERTPYSETRDTRGSSSLSN